MVQEAVEDGAGRRHVGEEFAPVLQRAVAGHDGGAVFVTAHDHFQQILPRGLGQGFEAHVVDDDQVGLEVAAQGFVLLFEGFGFEEVADQVEDRAVEHFLALLDGFVAQRLGQMGFADAGWAEEQQVLPLAQILAGGQFEELRPADGGVELPVEVFQAF